MRVQVVELDGSAEEQAAALAVVLRASRLDGRLHAALFDDDKLDLLHTVLASHKCLVSHHLLQVTGTPRSHFARACYYRRKPILQCSEQPYIFIP